MDGLNGGTTFTDSSPLAKSITANGNVQTSTTQSKFGNASALFDGNGDYLTIADSPDWNFGSGDFTIDFWFYLAATNITFFSQITNNTNYYLMRYNAGVWVFFVVVANVGIIDYEVVTGGVTSSAWHHFALVRPGSALKFFVDGTAIGVDGVAATIPDLTGVFNIGKDASINTNPDFNGYIDEFRVSKGIARWTSNFTPPISPYTIPGAMATKQGFWGDF